MEKIKFFFIFTTIQVFSPCNGISDGHFSTFQKVAENSKIVIQNGTESFLNETVDVELQCLMKRFDSGYLVEVTELSDERFHCRFFKRNFGDVAVVSSAGSLVYNHVLPELCQDLGKEKPDGDYSIRPYDGEEIEVLCDMTRHGGGWTTIQRRFDGSVNFNKEWADYKVGFGEAAGEYWLGLEHIHRITTKYSNMMVRMEATAFDGDQAYVVFQNFFVEGEENLYKLHAGTFLEGDASNKIDWEDHDGQYFSTKDNPNDQSIHYNCANYIKGGGWLNSCASYNFNGLYKNSAIDNVDSIFWKSLKYRTSLKSVSISIKRKE
uniref:Fibrinogen C-terminal domain-containing protein n=1 Tax=Clytia hemisphaerica TaxID=252671 RepID=A0A7M5WXA2_9CNID|eukprot:TCONS_00018874-protein